MDIPNCPTCGGLLRRVPKRKNKCPHCGDWVRWKYEPGQTQNDARLVGSIEDARIEALWHEREEQQRLERSSDNRQYVIENIRSLAKHPDVVAIKLCRSSVCLNLKCSATRLYFSIADALKKPPVPCHDTDQCYGSIEAVFDDELTPEIYVEAGIPFPSE